jgi:DNA-binding MarR family transcriptional regulator
MGLSLTEFKERFTQGFLEVQWKHWSALGVASHVEPEERWLIDIEALTLSTLVAGFQDTRLLNASIEWLVKNSDWLNLQRLKRIAKTFTAPLPKLSPRIDSLLDPQVFILLGNTFKRFGQKAWTEKGPGTWEFGKTSATRYEDFLSTFQMRNIVTDVMPQRPSLLQLRLRGILGIDARVEVLIYLLSNESGNSNAIAKEIFYDQKSVYRILEKWHKVGFLAKDKGPKIVTFTLEKRAEWLDLLSLREMPTYLNWVQVFRFLGQILKALSVSPWSEDEYMLSSLFRDLLDEAKHMRKYVHVSVPEPNQYPGSRYLVPFATAILDIIERLKGGGT